MSYSFSVRATQRETVLEKIAAEFDKVVSGQPMHARDREQAINAAKSFLELLPEAAEEGQVIAVSMHGSVGWRHDSPDGEQTTLLGAGVGISISLQPAS